MKKFFLIITLLLFVGAVWSQDCNILSKANDMLPSGICSPVTATWTVTYRGVTNAGTPVAIRFDWDDGTITTVPATNIGPGEWTATLGHVYGSAGNRCNYRPRATLIVNGVVCSSSTQEQIVTVWDNDNTNGGVLAILQNPHPICVGNAEDVRFQDVSQFNCVPPQENDVPNLNTRWVQWIYGTDQTFTGIPVTVNGLPSAFPVSGPIITLPGPITGSGIFSDWLNIADDKLVGQYFEVTLRNWNYCNPYDDPGIPGPPVDLVNGDHPPVITTARIIIVPYPDATQIPVDTLCVTSPSVLLQAVTPGGIWSGPGVSGNRFYPNVAGAGTHTIRYTITSGAGCTNFSEEPVTVMPVPAVSIDPVPVQFVNNPPFWLVGTPVGGTWSGPGLTPAGWFDPMAAGIGLHTIRYALPPDSWGCVAEAVTVVIIIMPPSPIASFDLDTLGCSPFEVSFTNNSVNATTVMWSFGDGTFSNEWEPTHTYYVPGIYMVRLTAYNVAGSSTTTRELRVLQNPVAQFSFYPPSINRREQVVVFLNLSLYADSYWWDLGDGTTSTDEHPRHIYTADGVYDVMLVVTTIDGCVDTLIKSPGIDVEFLTGEIKYPNAFRWNRSGPTGGVWDPNAIDNTVFRPHFYNVKKYEMLIFNRWGELIYSTNDIDRGWDGYLRDGSLAPEGVYVYKTWVTYSDGTFEIIAGDVTFLH